LRSWPAPELFGCTAADTRRYAQGTGSREPGNLPVKDQIGRTLGDVEPCAFGAPISDPSSFECSVPKILDGTIAALIEHVVRDAIDKSRIIVASRVIACHAGQNV
jgi:hypothetical protein